MHRYTEGMLSLLYMYFNRACLTDLTALIPARQCTCMKPGGTTVHT